MNFAAQYGFIDPYYFLPTVLTPTNPVNYLGTYGDSPSPTGNFYPNMFYPMQTNLQAWKGNYFSKSLKVLQYFINLIEISFFLTFS